jgi:hypothetical protein
MTYPTFNNGDVLPASDLNAIGLWLVKSQTVGTGVSSVTVTGAFSADYDNYKIIYTNGVQSVSDSLAVRFGAAATAYYGALVFANWLAPGVSSLSSNNSAAADYCGGGDSGFSELNCDVLMPFQPKTTMIMGNMMNGTAHGTFSYRLNDAGSYSSFLIFPRTGTMTGGTISVYGYRKP